mgnify:CR=1 FL=1
MSAPEKKTMFPALVVLGGILLYMAPAALAVATDFTKRDDPCRAQYTAPSADDAERLAELSVKLMNDHTGGDCTLSMHGMTREGYVDVMAAVSKNPRRSAEYNDAFVRYQN